jgi:low temperature requirement protein LtrA
MAYLKLPLIMSPLGESKSGHEITVTDQPDVETHDATLFENPQFEHYEATSNIQLFFDLFFVANLTSFTSSHEVNSKTALSSYIGFFCILWFTWCQVTLYDVRFSTDSVFERVCHACHFGVMMGFAVVGPNFSDPKNDTPWDVLQQLSLMLMTSRLVLFCQYCSTMYFAWKYTTTRKPLMAVTGSLAVAAALYFALSFNFEFARSDMAYLAWYVICVFEVGANIAIAGRWHVVSFKGTHLTERMTCLTLIILGEGVIGLTESITKIENLDYIFSPQAIGSLISALLIIYWVYQLYFDNVQMENFGIIRQQIWTFLHFPFHIALALLMEGINQFISYLHINQFINRIFDPITKWENNATSTELDLFNAMNVTVYNVLDYYFDTTEATWEKTLSQLQVLLPNSTASSDVIGNTTEAILVTLYTTVYSGYDFEPPENPDSEGQTPTVEEFENSYNSLFTLIFEYFFICAGLVLMFIGVLSWLSLLKEERRESRYRFIGIGANLIVGAGLMLMTLMITGSGDAASNLANGPWILPMFVLLLLFVLILNHIPKIVRKAKKSATVED